MKILITGAAGQLGTDLILALRRSGHEIVATDVREPPRRASGVSASGADAGAEDVDAGISWRGLDVTDGDAVSRLIAEVAPDRVFALAAILSARGERDPQLAYAVNQQGTYHTLEACRQHGVSQVVFTSTIAVYGSGMPDPTPEDVPLHPSTMYGVTKASGELLGAYYEQRYGLDVRGVRFPGLISAVLPGGGTSDYALYMYTEGITRGHYEAFCRPETRIPLMYMPDGVRALIELADAPGARLRRRIYNIAGFSPTAAEIAASVTRAVGQVSITFQPDPMRQAILDSWPQALDDSAARHDWGWKCGYDLEAMTAELVPRIRDMAALIAESTVPESARPESAGSRPIGSESAGSATR